MSIYKSTVTIFYLKTLQNRMAALSSRQVVKPPERGIFPLDHDSECGEPKNLFLQCLKANNDDYFPCRELSKAYLQCRMDKGLMAKEDMKGLGFDRNTNYARYKAVEGDTKEVHIAGTNVKPGSWWWKVRQNNAKDDSKDR